MAPKEPEWDIILKGRRDMTTEVLHTLREAIIKSQMAPPETLENRPLPIAVFAGSHEQYEYLCRMYGVNPRDPSQAVYMSGPEKCRGRRFGSVKVVGTFWERSDARELYEESERIKEEIKRHTNG